MQRRDGARSDLKRGIFRGHFDKDRSLGSLSGFIKVIAHGRTRISDLVTPYPTGGMDMAESSIVKRIESRIINLTDTSDGALRSSPGYFLPKGCHILMGYNDISLSSIDSLQLQKSSDRRIIVTD